MARLGQWGQIAVAAAAAPWAPWAAAAVAARTARAAGDPPALAHDPSTQRLHGSALATAQPGEDGAAPANWRLVGEFEPTTAIWLSYDEGHARMTAGLIRALHGQVTLKALVANDEAAEGLSRLLARERLPANAVQVLIDPASSFFLRDMAVFGRTAHGPLVLDFRWSEYGMPAWCRQRWPAEADARSCAGESDYSREGLDRHLGELAGAAFYRSSVAIEGGGFETNGQGTVLANAMLYRSRNPARPLADVDAALKRLPGVQQVIWLEAGLAEDPHLRASINRDYISWGTGGHSDEFVRFADARTVLLAWPEDDDVQHHPVARLTRERMARNWRILSASRAPDGQPWRIIKLPMPRPMDRSVVLSADPDDPRANGWSAGHFPAAERRREGQRLREVATATYMNFVIANGTIVAPDYREHGTPAARQARVQRLLEQAFPGRRIAFVDASSANWVGGGMHCATLNEY